MLSKRCWKVRIFDPTTPRKDSQRSLVLRIEYGIPFEIYGVQPFFRIGLQG